MTLVVAKPDHAMKILLFIVCLTAAADAILNHARLLHRAVDVFLLTASSVGHLAVAYTTGAA